MPKEDSVAMHKSLYWMKTPAHKEQRKLVLAERRELQGRGGGGPFRAPITK
jgi:hypothetical protein